MANTTTRDLNRMLSGETPLTTPSGEVLSPAKTTTGPTSNNPLDAATTIRGRNDEILMGGSLIRNPNKNKDIESARIGDYVYDQKGNPQVVPNSYRDVVNKYVIRTGENGVESLNLYDYMSALSKGVAAALGVPTDSSNVLSLLGTAAAGQAAKALPGGTMLWSAGNILKSLGDSEQAYADKYFNQEIDYDLGVDFESDENGKVIAKTRYDKMSTAGHGSGEKIISLTDTDKTGATLSDDNKLNITVSDVFAKSDAYKKLTDDLKDTLGSLTKEEANEVVDEDTGKTRIQTISDYIKQSETKYYYNAKSIASFKEVAPDASEESLAEATYTQLAGYVSHDNLEKMTITIYDEQNNKLNINAKTWLDSISKKDKTARNDYMNSIASRIVSDDISDDEKVVLQAQANALYGASDGDGDYAGMYKKDFFDSLGDASVPVLSQITWNDIGKSFGGYGTLDAFERNDFYAGALQVGQTFANAKILSAFMNWVETGLRGVAQAAGDGILSGTGLGKALSNINTYAPQDVPVRLPGSTASTTGPSIVASNWKEYLGKTAVQTGAQAAADLVVDALKGATYKQLGYEDRFDFLDEFASDVLFDALMSYGPRNYVERAEKTAYKVLDSEERFELEDIDGEKTGEVLTVPGTKIVEKTADEVAKIHAERIDKLTDSDLALKTQEIFADKNAAFAKLAVQVRRVVDGDNYLYRLMLRAGSDIRQLTNDVRTAFNQTYKTELNAFLKTLNEVAPKVRDWTQADRNYFNAVIQQHRFSAENSDNKEALKDVESFYSKALNGIDDDRKAELNRLITTGRNLAGTVLDFYKRAGILSEKTISDLRSKPAYKGGMFFPVWQKNGKIRGGEIAQTRAVLKSVWNKAELIDVEDMEDPLVTLTQYIGNAARNVAVNERAKVIRTVGSVPGMKLHLVSDTGGGLGEVENLKELNERFAKQYDKIVKQVNSEYPTREEWQKQNDQFVMRSKAFKVANELEQLQKDGIELRKAFRRAKYVADKEPTQEKVDELFDADNLVKDNKQAQLYSIDRLKVYMRPLLKRASDASKSDVKLDIDTYLNVQVTNMLKSALKDNQSTSKIQIILNDAVEKANPYVDKAEVIQRNAEEAAMKFRKSVNKSLKIKGNKKTSIDRLNELADKVTDEIEARVMGQKATVKVIDDAEATRILNESGDSHTIRYLLDGAEQRMILTGKGSEQLVKEFYAPEGWIPKSFAGRLLQKAINAAGWVSNTKRVMTSSFDVGRVMPNLARDWSRGIVTTGGQILVSPEMIRDWAISMGDGSKESLEIIDNGLELVREGIDRSTFTSSMEVPKKNRAKSMIRAANEPDGNAFVRFIYDRTESPTKLLSTLQDMGESYTRIRAMEIGYYRELANSYAKDYSTDEAVKRAIEAAYFYGREATTNFYRRGKLIAAIARNVPYFSQNFATLESFKYTFLDNPIATTRALQDTTLAYASLIALALSNEESRKKYYLLSEYDRANNIIIPLTNDSIITIPLDETMAAFLTPYRRTIESLAGLDPEAFYVIFAETLEALSPFDLSGFSEGDKINVVRGLEKLGSQMIPTWAQPLVEAMTGRDLYYGSNLKVTQEDIGQQTGNWNATPGQLTTKSKNSKTLADVSEHTGIPQWILQNMLSEYFGSTGQYALNTIDKLAGATEEAQGGKEWSDSIFKPFTGSDSNQVNQAFWDGVNNLKMKKQELQRELKTIKNDMESATGNAKAELENKRREKINEYGLKVSDFLNEYLSAYEITGGLSKSQANQVWYLYKIYDEDGNSDMYDAMTTGEYYSNKLATYNNRRATALAASSGVDAYIDSNIAKPDTLAKNVFDPNANYYETYAQQAFMNSVYGDATQNVYRLETALKDANLLGNKMWEGYDDAKAKGKSVLKKYKNDWNTEVLLAIAPTVEEVGLDAIIGSSTVLDYLDNYLFDVTTFNRKQYIKKAFGG